MSTTSPVVFLYSGQGSQYYGMGKDLYDANAAFRSALDRYDALAAAELGHSVLARIHDPGKPRSHPLTDTLVTHPGIVMIELALTDALRAEGVEPGYILGSSLGEYAAAVVAGAMSAEDCLRVLVRQARALRAAPPGGMLAVLTGLDVLDRLPELRACEIAARNYPGSFALAGPETELAAAEGALLRAGVPHLRLPVEYGFHSRVVEDVLEASRDTLGAVSFSASRLPWMSCVGGRWVERADAAHFLRVARRPIDFALALRALPEHGDLLYLDLGPSGSLNNFVRELLPAAGRERSLPLLSPYERDTTLFARALARAPRTPAAPPAPPPRRRLKVYGFPGQGSQRRGMGAGLFARFPRETALADEILGYCVEELCRDDPGRRLTRTEFTQPALYVVGALSYLARIADDPQPPDYLVGHSLGEYAALFAAGVFDFATGLRLVRRRGELMAQAGAGAMAAVVGVDEQTVTRLLAGPALAAVDLANHNAPDQFVLSGPEEGVDAACAAFEAAGARTVRLRVSAPLHSRYMRGASEQFARVLAEHTFSAPAVPVLANVDALPYTPATLRQRLAAQIASPVRWTATVRALLTEGDLDFTELGPGTVLTKLVARIAGGPPAEPGTPVPSAGEAAPAPAAAGPAPVAAPPPAAPVPAAPAPSRPAPAGPAPGDLGAPGFRERYGLRRAYALGSMYGGISGSELLRASAKAGLLAFLGTGGLTPPEVDAVLRELDPYGPVGVNVGYRHDAPRETAALIDLLLRRGVDLVEASGFPTVTEELVRFRLRGGRILAKVSRPDVAAAFLAPPPDRIVARLLAAGEVTEEQARAAAARPVADDLCAEADGGWLCGTADTMTLLPAVLRLRDRAALPGHRVHVGAAGGLGSPEAVAAAFLLGADFVMTGSVNQCSVEAATSDEVKDLLQQAREHDIATAPWAEQFALGVRARYLRRGLLFPARADALFDLWRGHDWLGDLDEAARDRVMERYLGGPGVPVPHGGAPATAGGTAELTALLRHYFTRAFGLAVTGDPAGRVDYLVHCGPAMGAFNRTVEGTGLAPWRARSIEAICDLLMDGAAARLAAPTAATGTP